MRVDGKRQVSEYRACQCVVPFVVHGLLVVLCFGASEFRFAATELSFAVLMVSFNESSGQGLGLFT